MSSLECGSPLECECLKSCGKYVRKLAKFEETPNIFHFQPFQPLCETHINPSKGCFNVTAKNCLSIPTSQENDPFRGSIFCSNYNELIENHIFSDVRGKKGKKNAVIIYGFTGSGKKW